MDYMRLFTIYVVSTVVQLHAVEDCLPAAIDAAGDDALALLQVSARTHLHQEQDTRSTCTCKTEWNYNDENYRGCAHVDGFPGRWCYVEKECTGASPSTADPNVFWTDCAIPGAEFMPETMVDTADSCAVLKNQETHSTVQVRVGTPEQLFDIVADTGSNNVIIPSCLCKEKVCHNNGTCFEGTKRSSRFSVEDPKHVPKVTLSFGSGDIAAAVVTDIVRVGDINASMTEGLLLMVDNNLDIPIEGILGLGPPIEANMTDESDPADRSFLKYAGVSTFSMCFNQGADGVLRLGNSVSENALVNIGVEHWGVDFRGISVGGKSVDVQFCTTKDMRPEQETPCGGIPDSGTTMITGPSEQLVQLFEGICNDWKLCQEADKQSGGAVPKYVTFQQVLMGCEEWMKEGSGLDELPTLFFHIGDPSGKKQVLELGAESYIMMADASNLDMFTRRVGLSNEHHASLLSIPEQRKQDTVCFPAFSELKYETVKNGPVWILGTPIFYNYQVGYDMASKPATISFKDDACGYCHQEDASESTDADHKKISAVDASDSGKRQRLQSPRHLSAPGRVPRVDVSKPL